MAEDISQIKREFVHQLYVAEVLATQVEYQLGDDLEAIISTIIKGEAEFHLKYQERQTCEKCQIPLKV